MAARPPIQKSTSSSGVLGKKHRPFVKAAHTEPLIDPGENPFLSPKYVKHYHVSI
jgi:hypothetical protein